MLWQEQVKRWEDFTGLPVGLKADLNQLKTTPDVLKEAFYKPLEFGTAGMRGILGAGTNRMNSYTVRHVTEALARLVNQIVSEDNKKSVVIAYDSRHYSPEFAEEAARVLANHQIKVYLFDELRPTPELSFAVRELGCVAGIMITASHNPAHYNGYKLYGSDGGQMAPDDISIIVNELQKITDPFNIQVADVNSDYIEMIGEKMDELYLKEIQTVTMNQELVAEYGKALRIVYTPLHGVGLMMMQKAFNNAGFESVLYEPSQSIPNGDFPTVPSPNPEEPSAFELAFALGEAEDAELLIATDPDADRMGAAIRDNNGKYQVLTGNQIAALLVAYILRVKTEQAVLPENGVVLKSIVSSELPTAICQKYNVEMLNVLTGFKFIAEKIEEFEQTNTQEFLFGFEESFGFLVKPFVRDKDAIQAALLLAEVTAYYKSQNKTLYDGLNELFEEFGYFEEKTISITLPGIEGSDKIASLMKTFRTEGLHELAGTEVLISEDYQSQLRLFSDGRSEQIEMLPADVLKYYFSDDSWVAIRPSGTEPKIKFYIGVKDRSVEKANEKIKKYENAIYQLIK
ncbi:phospho-sugar mutase [Vagococcus coleopterorum]|uniref:Phosphoglucomutase n=1 Tax=Vagococcus coleopterorum TaxID=2714946 RepID=A0A6G8APU3_9ENTE|nr:phospho-sugar mutase [Vagococcus coleopterorum]QIL46989.1 phospho-sugar mutase [Vagococcus coleopterorum]